jgi:uncharacterized membrane protein
MREHIDLRKHDFKWDLWTVYKITEAIFSMIGTVELIITVSTISIISWDEVTWDDLSDVILNMIFLVPFAAAVLEFQLFERRFFPEYKQSRAVSLLWIWVPASVVVFIICIICFCPIFAP